MAKVTDVIKNLAGFWLVENGSGVLRGKVSRPEPGKEEMDGHAP
jgi:hypothetical protein